MNQFRLKILINNFNQLYCSLLGSSYLHTESNFQKILQTQGSQNQRNKNHHKVNHWCPQQFFIGEDSLRVIPSTWAQRRYGSSPPSVNIAFRKISKFQKLGEETCSPWWWHLWGYLKLTFKLICTRPFVRKMSLIQFMVLIYCIKFLLKKLHMYVLKLFVQLDILNIGLFQWCISL